MSAAMGERSSFTAPRVGKLADVVYDSLKAQIHDFQLVAGDRFSEAELAQRLGVSRTPVREALFRLRDEGFLGVESKLGWYVLPIDFGRLDLRGVLGEVLLEERLADEFGEHLRAELAKLRPSRGGNSELVLDEPVNAVERNGLAVDRGGDEWRGGLGEGV